MPPRPTPSIATTPVLPSIPPAAEPALLSAAAVAQRCGVSLRHVRRLIANRALPVHRLGRVVRVAEADLQRFLAACRGEMPVSAKS